MNFYNLAQSLKEETVAHRRYLHQNAEAGLDMPIATAYITQELKKIGLSPTMCGKGITATIGRGERTILLRADMDALPSEEQSGLDFSSVTSCAHTCGHDMHAAMLLTAAKILKQNETKLNGKVKLMFQPAEENLLGCQNMIDNGVLENPTVNAALALHVTSGRLPVGSFMYNDKTAMMNSADVFRILIHGKGGHGAYPNLTVDPVNIAVHIYSALQSLISREADPEKSCTLTIGRISAGETANVIPETAVLEGSLRTNDQSERDRLYKRITEICKGISSSLGGKAEVSLLASVPTLVCDPQLTSATVNYISELSVPSLNPLSGIQASASEDFALIAAKVPSAYIYLSAGYNDERGDHLAHNPKVLFNEDVLPLGSALLSHVAFRWLEDF